LTETFGCVRSWREIATMRLSATVFNEIRGSEVSLICQVFVLFALTRNQILSGRAPPKDPFLFFERLFSPNTFDAMIVPFLHCYPRRRLAALIVIEITAGIRRFISVIGQYGRPLSPNELQQTSLWARDLRAVKARNRAPGCESGARNHFL